MDITCSDFYKFPVGFEPGAAPQF